MTEDEFLKVKQHIEKKAYDLLGHESKISRDGIKGRQDAKVGLPISNHNEYLIKERIFYSCETVVFKEIFNGVLIEAVTRYPNKFGTGNATDVIEAINQLGSDFNNKKFAEYLQHEQFCWVVESVNGEILGDVLRIELFRQLDLKRDSKDLVEFTGGIFHAFKHFSYNNTNLSTGKDKNNISNLYDIISFAIKAFFFEEREPHKKGFISKVELNSKYNLLFVFYLESVTGIYFINSIHLQKKKSKLKRANN